MVPFFKKEGGAFVNTDMLKAIIDLAGGEVESVDAEVFFKQFPRSADTFNDLRALKEAGYISLLGAGDDLMDIDVKQEALDYFK